MTRDGFPVGAVVMNIRLRCGRRGLHPWVGEGPLEEGMATHSSILAWTIPMDRGAWGATVRGVAESRARLTR